MFLFLFFFSLDKFIIVGASLNLNNLKMLFPLFLNLLVSAYATASPQLLQTRQSTSCTTPNGPGFCGSTSNGCSGTFYAGYCPGASNIQCCVKSCSTPSGAGFCQYTSSTCSGSFISGYCPGASDYQVCSASSLRTCNKNLTNNQVLRRIWRTSRNWTSRNRSVR